MGFLIFIIIVFVLFRPRRRWWYRPYHYDMFGPRMHHMDDFGPHGGSPHHGMEPGGFGHGPRR